MIETLPQKSATIGDFPIYVIASLPLRTELDIFTNVSLRFLSHSNFATLTNRKRCNWTPRGRMYCARRPLACYVHNTCFVWAVRVAYFKRGSEGLSVG